MRFAQPRKRCRLVPGKRAWLVVAGILVVSIPAGPAYAAQPLRGTVRVDGSSTVAPITMAAAEMFGAEHPRVRVTVGISGTGGGFKKFLEQRASLRTDINDASRPISPAEIQRARELGVEFVEIPIAYDGIAVVVHPSNDFCDYLTIEELRRIWEPGSQITNWSQVRRGFPDRPLHLYGPGTDSGTFDYFTEVVVGKVKSCRSDYTASENDNVLVQGVAGDPAALGYFGLAYYEANHERLRIVPIDNGAGQRVVPTRETVRSGQYRPLSRPLFLYINRDSLERPEVTAFVEFLLSNAPRIVEHPRVNYVALSEEMYRIALERVRQRVTGTVFAGHETGLVRTSLESLFSVGLTGQQP